MRAKIANSRLSVYLQKPQKEPLVVVFSHLVYTVYPIPYNIQTFIVVYYQFQG